MNKSELLLLLFLAIKVLGKCQVAPLSAISMKPCDTILSGTVKSFFLRGSAGTFAGKVKVRRVFRGDKGMFASLLLGWGINEILLNIFIFSEEKKEEEVKEEI